VYVFLYTDVQTSAAGRGPTLDIVNDINAGYWVGDLYIDEGGHLRGEWAVPVKAGTPLSGLLVANIVHRYAGIWFDAFPRFARCAPCQVKADDTDDKPKSPTIAGEKQVSRPTPRTSSDDS
jgi:Putative bacterial sensory transduction regulator